MAEYRIRYIVGRDARGRPDYHSVTISADEPPSEDEAIAVAFLHEGNLYEEEGADEVEVDNITELAARLTIVLRPRARYVLDPESGDWVGPLFDGRAR